MLTTEQQAKVATWVKKAVAATFTGTAPARAEGMPAASGSSSGSKAQKAKLEAETAAVMHLLRKELTGAHICMWWWVPWPLGVGFTSISLFR